MAAAACLADTAVPVTAIDRIGVAYPGPRAPSHPAHSCPAWLPAKHTTKAAFTGIFPYVIVSATGIARS